MTDIEHFQRAILDLHGLQSHHVGSVRVHETFEGKAWDGIVEIFQVHDYTLARFAYAWNYQDDAGETRRAAVLGVPPINLARDAVKAFIVSRA